MTRACGGVPAVRVLRLTSKMSRQLKMLAEYDTELGQIAEYKARAEAADNLKAQAEADASRNSSKMQAQAREIADLKAQLLDKTRMVQTLSRQITTRQSARPAPPTATPPAGGKPPAPLTPRRSSTVSMSNTTKGQLQYQVKVMAEDSKKYKKDTRKLVQTLRSESDASRLEAARLEAESDQLRDSVRHAQNLLESNSGE